MGGPDTDTWSSTIMSSYDTSVPSSPPNGDIHKRVTRASAAAAAAAAVAAEDKVRFRQQSHKYVFEVEDTGS